MRRFLSIFFLFGLIFPGLANATIYQPGETLEPDCAPGSANCGVATSTLIGVTFGGTGLTSAPSYGNMLVGNSSGGYTLTATSSLGLESSSGTVSSIALTVPTGLTVTGSPITASGTLDISLSPGFVIPTSASAADWDTAFANRITSAFPPLAIINHALSLSTSGDWAGTLDGQEGSFYLDALNLNNFGSPFYNFFSATTTDALSQGLTNRYYSDSFVLSLLNASTTIARTSASNIFTESNTFNGPVTLGAMNGPLQANAGLVSATSSIGVSYGGTGATSFGQGWLFSTGGPGALSASTSPTVSFITATSTTATSTFANGINILGGGLKVGNLTSCHNLGTDGLGNVQCELGQFAVDVRKSADQSTTTDVLANDTELVFPIGANEVWVFRFDLMYSTGGTPDIQVAVTAPTGATCDYAVGQFTNSISLGSTTCGGPLAIFDGTVTSQALPLGGSVSNGGTSGTVRLQFAQNNANATPATIMRGSSLSAYRVSGGADLGEVYYSKDTSLMPGTVVTLDPSLPAGIRRAETGDIPAGIVSTKPGVVIGDTAGAHNGIPVIIALAGRVPVQVVTENGPIEPGDYLVQSATPGAAMKSDGSGSVIGQAMSEYAGEGAGFVVALVKNINLGAQAEHSVLLGDVSPNSNPDGSDNGLSTIMETIQTETDHNPVAVITQKMTDGKQFLTNFVTARITAIRGYFDEIFARAIHSQKICLKKSDGSETCVNGDELNALLQNANIAPVVYSEPEPEPEPEPELQPEPELPSSEEMSAAESGVDESEPEAVRESETEMESSAGTPSVAE